MNDAESRFARTLGLSVGRLDFWNIRDNFTPYEWTVLWVMNQVEPVGEKRADIRQALATQHLIAHLTRAQLSTSDIGQIRENLSAYLAIDNAGSLEDTLSAEALKKMRESGGNC